MFGEIFVFVIAILDFPSENWQFLVKYKSLANESNANLSESS